MESFSHWLSGVLNVRIFCPVASVCICSILCSRTNMTRSPRSFGLALLMLFSAMHVLSKMNPAGSSSVAYWIFASCGENCGSGIVMERFSHSLGSSRFVLSSSMSTGVSFCMIPFLDLGGIGGGVVGSLGSIWFTGGAVDIRFVLCCFCGVRPRLVYLLGVFWLPAVICAQFA